MRLEIMSTQAAKKAGQQPPEPPAEGEQVFDPEVVKTELATAGLHAKIAWVQQHVGHVDKSGRLEFGSTKYNYMQEHGLINVLRPLWRIAGISVAIGMDSPDSYEAFPGGARVTVGATITDIKSGDSITKYFVNEGQDKGDKSFSKAFTAATKYALQKLFLVPTEAIDDNDAVASEELATQVAAQVHEITSVKPDEADITALRGLMMEEANKGHFPANKVKNYLTGEFGVSKLDELNKIQLRAAATWVAETIAQGAGAPSE
jgi:hypothetical protein